MSTGSGTFTGLLRKAAAEIEQLKVQLALGKAEAHDKYEELKKKFGRFISATKAKTKNSGKSSIKTLHSDLQELELQLALGKAETRKEFAEQKKKIDSSMRKLERNVKAAAKKSDFEEALLHEIEATRLKLEMLQVHYALGKLDSKDAFEKQKHNLEEIIAKAKKKVGMKEFSERRQKAHAELKEAYRHLKKAYVSA